MGEEVHREIALPPHQLADSPNPDAPYRNVPSCCQLDQGLEHSGISVAGDDPADTSFLFLIEVGEPQRPDQWGDHPGDPGQVHVFQGVDDHPLDPRVHLRIQEQPQHGIEKQLGREIAGSADIAAHGVGILARLGEERLGLLDRGPVEELAEGHHAGLLEIRDPFLPRVVEDLEDLLARVADVQGTDDPDQAVQAPHQGRVGEVDLGQGMIGVESNAAVVVFEQRPRGPEAVALVFGRRDHPIPYPTDEGEGILVGIDLEEALHFLKQVRRSVLLQGLGQQHPQQGFLLLDSLEGHGLLLDLGEKRLKVRSRGEDELVEQDRRVLLDLVDDLGEEVAVQGFGVRVDVRDAQKQAEHPRRVLDVALVVGQGHQERGRRPGIHTLEGVDDVVLLWARCLDLVGAEEEPEGGGVELGDFVLEVFDEVAGVLACGIQDPVEDQALHLRLGGEEVVLDVIELTGLEQPEQDRFVVALAESPVHEHGEVELPGLGVQGRDLVDGPEDFLADLGLLKYREVLAELLDSRGGVDRRQGPDRRGFLIRVALLDQPVQVRNCNLVPDRARSRDGRRADL